MLIAHAAENFDLDDSAFVHAVALACAADGGARIASLHVGQGFGQAPPTPQAGVLLQRWGLPADRVTQNLHLLEHRDELADDLIAACQALQPDLVVMATHARSGVLRVLSGSVAEAVARNLTVPCLLLPLASRGFVQVSSGQLELQRTLVLGGTDQDAQLGLDAAAWLARLGKPACAELSLLHVEDGTPAPVTHAPPDCRVHCLSLRGSLEAAVLAGVAQTDPNVLVMVSRGHDQLRDVLFASRTERVLHSAGRPLLWVPAGFRAPAH